MHHIAYTESLRRARHDAAEATRGRPDPDARHTRRRHRARDVRH